MNTELLLNKLVKIKLHKNIHYFDQLTSTNNKCLELAENGAPEWTLVIAGEQTMGRGRHERNWICKKDTGILFSCILKPDIPIFNIQLISLLLGVLIIEFFQKTLKSFEKSNKKSLKFGVKWPNDIFLNGKKMGGILLQSSVQNKFFNYIICGVGLNINNLADDFSEEIRDKATSLRIETDIIWEREKLLIDLLTYLKKEYEILDNDYSQVALRWKKKALYLGKQIKVHQYDKLIRGKFLDISDKGYLILENYDGQSEVVTGDIFGRNEKA